MAEVLRKDPQSLSGYGPYIKFIVTRWGVVFDPRLFRDFEERFGENALCHADIADAHQVRHGEVLGGAGVHVYADRVVISGSSRQFGGLAGYEEEARLFFSDYFACPVELAGRS